MTAAVTQRPLRRCDHRIDVAAEEYRGGLSILDITRGHCTIRCHYVVRCSIVQRRFAA